MAGGYHHISDQKYIENGLLKDLNISNVPLAVISIGRTYNNKKSNADFGVRRENGRLDYQLIYLKRGHMQLFSNGKNLTLESNTVLLFKPGEPQIYAPIFTTEEETVERFYIHFSGDRVAEMLENYNIHFQFIQLKEPFEAFEDCINRMISYKEQPHSDRFFSLLLEELFILLSRALQNEQPQIYSRGFDSLITTMKNTCTQNLPIKYYADLAGFHENYFLRFFKKAMGVSPHKYLTDQRLNKACELLVYSQDSIKNIAFRLGYQNQHHFSNSFHKKFQLSPTEFRTMHAKTKKESK